MRVFLTGGAGLIGRAIAARLLESGHEVHSTDLVPETDAPCTTYAVCDITNFAAVRDHLQGCDAVVHMAALRNPFYGPGQEIFRINAIGTFNVFEAAAQAGIRRIVQASSINAIGCSWNIGDFMPDYLPLDENHPRVTSDPYSFSKQQIEDTGAYYWRRDGIASTALRFPGVYKAAPRLSDEAKERRRGMRAFLDEFAALPEAEREQQIARVRQHCLTFRGERRLEYPDGKWHIPSLEGIDDRLLNTFTFDRFNLWASLDERDAALAVEKSLTASLEGSHPLFISNPQNSLHYESRTLARLFFPEVAWQGAPSGAESLFSIQRASDLIGFHPQYAPAPEAG